MRSRLNMIFSDGLTEEKRNLRKIGIPKLRDKQDALPEGIQDCPSMICNIRL